MRPMNDAGSALERQADAAAAARQYVAAADLLGQAAALQPDRSELWTKLSAMRRVSGDLPGALEAIERALARAPLDFSNLLGRAFILEQSKSDQAGEAFCEAVAQLPSGDTVPPPMRAAVDHALQRSADHKKRISERLSREVGNDLSPAEAERAQRFVRNVARETKHYHQEPTHFHYPGLPEIEFHPVESFSGLSELAALTDVIRAELDDLLQAQGEHLVPYIQYPERIALRQWEELNQNKRWSAIHLLQNGTRVEQNARHCPRTMEALARLDQPVVPGASPNAMFSLLAPNTHIPPHTGVANTRLVAHLPLIVPPDCDFRCGATTVKWEVGKPFVFDDTIEHEAWNNSDQLRIVLIFDLWVPHLSPRERAAVSRIMPAAGTTSAGM